MNLLVTGARAPIAADLVRALSLAGHRVWVSDSVRWPLGACSPFAQGYLRLPPPRQQFSRFRAELAASCQRLSLDAIIPTSEEVFWLAGAQSHLPASVSLRTSPLPVLSALHHKARFARLACQLGYGAPENIELTSPADFPTLADPSRYVLKPAYSRFAAQTLLSPTPAQLARLHPTSAAPWFAQTRVTGRELCAYNVAHAGRLLLHAAYEPRVRFGVGASVYFSPVLHDGLRAMSEEFITATGFTGQISFDAIETAAGLVALECNPRGTSGVHLAAQQPEVLSAALLGALADPAPSFAPEPRMLLLPLLLQYPGILLRPSGRKLLREGRDALSAAGIPNFSQVKAIAEMSWRAARIRTSLARVSTADFEWNGEPMYA